MTAEPGREAGTNRYAVPLDDLEADAHVPMDDLVESQAQDRKLRLWTSWDEQERMLRLAGAGG